MWSRRSNSKRSIALLGAMLALLPGAQQLHLLCHFTECAQSVSESGGESQSRAAISLCCCCSHACLSPCAPQNDRGDEQQNSDHCPQECWCCQTPQLLHVQKVGSNSIELVLLGMASTYSPSITATEQRDSLSSEWASASAWTSTSNVQRCAMFCRFLI